MGRHRNCRSCWMWLLAVGLAVAGFAPVADGRPTAAGQRGALVPLPGRGACLAEGPLTRCARVDGLGDPVRLDISPDGGTLYATVQGTRSVTLLHRDRTSGALTREACWSSFDNRCSPARGLGRQGDLIRVPRDVTVSPDGRNVYAVSWAPQMISVVAFARDPRD